MIKPTVGRMILYTPPAWDKQGPKGMAVGTGKECAGIIVAVHGDKCINAVVFDGNGEAFSKTSVNLLQDDDKPYCDGEGNDLGGYCKWMEYQKGQAAKTEELEKKFQEEKQTA